MMGNFVSGYIMRVSDDGVNYQGYLADIENTLEEFQSIVAGNIEVIRISYDVLAVLNECGKFNGFNPSRLWKVNDYLDVIHGNIVCVRSDNDGNFVSIQDEDITVIKECLVAIKGIHNVGGNTVIITVPDEYLEKWG